MEETTWFIAVHIGAGYYDKKNFIKYKNLMKKSCRAASLLLKENKNSIDAITSAITILEDDECTNAGNGSSLNIEGKVECDASIMSGKTKKFAAVGAAVGVKNPIQISSHLLKELETDTLSFGRIKPIILVGIGCWKYAKNFNLSCAKSEEDLEDYLVTVASKNLWKIHIEKIKTKSDEIDEKFISTLPHDTVGAICIDSTGHISSGVSSGGHSVSYPGRIGEAASFGCGCWASNETDENSGVAISCTGTGEDIILSLLAKECYENVKNQFIDEGVNITLNENFKNRQAKKKQVGLIALKKENESIEFAFGFTTHSMGICYFSNKMKNPIAIIRTNENFKTQIEVVKI
eukprot:gene1482-12100_t